MLLNNVLNIINEQHTELLELRNNASKFINKVSILHKALSVLDNQTLSKTYSERQSHGFKYEDDFIKQNHLTRSESYTAKFDAYHNDTPVQIKYIKNKCEVCLADYMRNATISQDFILHVAFYEADNKLQIASQYTLYIDHNI